MNNKELLKEVAKNLAAKDITLSQKKLKAVVEELFETTIKHACKGEAVKLPIGVCTRKFKPTRTYRNPTTNQPVVVKEHFVPTLRFSKIIKEKFAK